MMPLFKKNPNHANKIEGWPNGWYEEEEPVVLGHGNERIRRFFKNDALDCTMWVEEVIPTNFFQASFSMFACIDYRDPKTGGFYQIECEGVTYDENTLIVRDENSVPEDDELASLFEDVPSVSTGNRLFDMYGTVCIMTKVKDEDHAFKIAELMARRNPNLKK
ncbi:MAG: hypothetical protein M0P69_09200 [Bacteroidales bacterium]|nr:hypothetical protein [Bacteroidales bacterium]